MAINISFLSKNKEVNTKNQNVQQPAEEKKSKALRITEASLLGVATILGVCYFAKNHNLKNAAGKTKKIVTDSNMNHTKPSVFNPESTYSGDMIFSESSSTYSVKPIWNAQVSGYTLSLPESTPRRKPPVKKEIPAPGHSLQEVIPPSKIKELTTEIKVYMQRSGIDEKNKKINPEALDEILTRTIGKDKVKERPFKPAECMSKGRVKEYTAPNGRIYVLETHLHKEEGYVTRLYLTHRDRDLRAYLHPDGSFRLNSYGMRLSHFETTAKGKRWMENSPFLTGKKD